MSKEILRKQRELLLKTTLKLQASLAPWKLYLKNEMWLKTSAQHFRYPEHIS